MPAAAVEITLIVLLIIANDIFALSETAVVSARRARLQERAEQGDAGAQVALDLAREPTRFLSTVQIGITLVGILTGAFGEKAARLRSQSASQRRQVRQDD